MAKASEAVNNCIREMYAVMATAAAQRAVNQIVFHGHTVEADRLASYAEVYLTKAHAKAATYTYRMPRING